MGILREGDSPRTGRDTDPGKIAVGYGDNLGCKLRE